MSNVDGDGQPFNSNFNRAARADRDIAELLGLAKGFLSDGILQPTEVAFLEQWVREHPTAHSTWPVSAVRERIENIMRDRTADEAERNDLAELLRQIVGGDGGTIEGRDATTELPLDRPAPELTWTGSVYVFTGKMACGTRKACQARVHELGGKCEDDVTRRTTYLILGSFGSRDWKHTSFGRKIEAAVQQRLTLGSPALVSEQHWAEAAR